MGGMAQFSLITPGEITFQKISRRISIPGIGGLRAGRIVIGPTPLASRGEVDVRVDVRGGPRLRALIVGARVAAAFTSAHVLRGPRSRRLVPGVRSLIAAWAAAVPPRAGRRAKSGSA
jgi:hypothetical protein